MSDHTKELQTDITVQDLKVILNIIELASSKGLFKGADLAVVGEVFNKIKESIKASEE